MNQTPSVPPDEEIFVLEEPDPILGKGMSDPFTGKCIHGNDGARLELGRLVNSKCEHCNARVIP